MMKISVALATHNGSRFVADQLRSLIDQVRTPDELVVSDDASDDATLNIVRSVTENAPFTVVINQNPHRLGFARNFLRASGKCTGDLVAFCDQDDVWHPQKLARCEKPFVNESNVAVVCHSATVVNEQLQPQGWAHPDIRRERYLQAGCLPPFTGYPGFSLVFRRIVLPAIAYETLPRRLAPDSADQIEHDLWTSLVYGCLGHIVLLSAPLAYHRQHRSNASIGLPTDYSSRFRTTLQLRNPRRTYLRMASLATERRDYLKEIARSAVGLDALSMQGLVTGIASHGRYASALENRANMYARSSRMAKASSIIHSVARHDYAASSRGGLGFSSLLRDITLGMYRQ